MTADGFERALALINVERFFEALPLLNEAIASQPGFVEAYVERGKLRRRLNDAEGAIADYSKAIKLAPAASLYLARALVWLSLEKAAGAVGDARRAIALNSELAGAHRLLGKSLGLLGDGEGAIAAYKQAARCYINAKDKENAAACIEKIGPLQALPPLLASRKQAIAGYGADSLVERTATPEEFLKRLWQKYEQKQYQTVLKDVDWLLQCEPKNTEAMCLRGLVCAQMGQAQRAVEEMARAMSMVADDTPEKTTVRFCRAQMRLVLSDGAGAVEDLSELIESVGPEVRFLTQRAVAYRSIGDLEEALADYSRVITLEPENAELYQARAEAQQAKGEKIGAIEDYQRAATLWLNAGKWAEHQPVVEAVRRLREGDRAAGGTVGSGTAVNRNQGSSVPIKSYKNHLPVVEVVLNSSERFDIVVDRNASHSIVTQQMAARLGLEMVSYQYVYLASGVPMELPIGLLKSVTIGGVTITDVYAAIAPDKETALLGKDCFGFYSVRISGNEITVAR